MPVFSRGKKRNPTGKKFTKPVATPKPGGPNRGGYAGAPPPSYAEGPYPSPAGRSYAEGPYPSPAGPGYWQGPPRAIEPPNWDFDYLPPSLMPKLDTGGWGDPPLDPGSGPGDMPGMKPGPGGGSPIGGLDDFSRGLRNGLDDPFARFGSGLREGLDDPFSRFGDQLKGNLGGGNPLGMTDLMARVRGGMPDMGPAAVGAPMDPLMLALLRLQMQR